MKIAMFLSVLFLGTVSYAQGNVVLAGNTALERVYSKCEGSSWSPGCRYGAAYAAGQNYLNSRTALTQSLQFCRPTSHPEVCSEGVVLYFTEIGVIR